MGGLRISRWGIGLAFVALASAAAGCDVAKVISPSPSPTFDPAPPAGWAWHDSPIGHRDAIGQTFDYVCPANGGFGYLAGTDVYTDDSSVCTAAVHAGWLTREVGGIVRVVVRPGQATYEGSLRNGILSEPYDAWAGSFAIVAGCRGDTCASTP